MHNSFIAWVKERRGERLTGVGPELFDGRFWTGKVALEHGLIDGIGDVRGVMREKFGENVKLVDIAVEKKLPFPLSLFMQGSFADDLADTMQARAMQSRYGL